jgi:hypothetical protein
MRPASFRSVGAIAVLAFAFQSFTPNTTYAQSAKHSASASNPDEAAIHDYILSMEKVNTYAAVGKKLQSAASADPAMAAEMKKVEDADVPNVEKASLIEKSLHTAAFLKANGMTARDFVLIPMTVITAGIALSAQDAKGKPPAFVNPANIQFVRDHKSELEKLQLFGASDTKEDDTNDKHKDNDKDSDKDNN